MTYERNMIGQVSKVTTTVAGVTSTVADSIIYMPFGGIKSYTLGNGVAVTRTHDLDYRLVEIKDQGGATIQDLKLYYDLRSNIEALEDSANSARSQSFGYDNLSRLTSADGAYGLQGFTYDGAGNRLTQSITPPGGNTSTGSYSYPATSHRLSSISDGTSFSYDPAGNVTQKGGLSLSYNAANRQSSATLGATSTAATYNAAGQRVIKTAGGETTVFHYDRSGHLLAETDAAGQPRREYVYLENMPLSLTAYIRKIGRAPEGKGAPAGRGPPPQARVPDQAITVEVHTYYVHTDHLNTPQKLTDQNQQVAWDAVYEPFGKITLSTGLVVQPLRFPGQYFDAETGLHQNWNRDYDPSLGRYIQSDPIGLEGGLNTYAYVRGNPLSFIDFMGLVEGSPQNIARRQFVQRLAEHYVGSNRWDYTRHNNAQYPANSWKCSGFTCDVLNEANAGLVVTVDGHDRCLTAGELANKGWKPSDWRTLAPGEQPEPGDVAAYKIDRSFDNDPDVYTGHTGVVTAGGVTAAHKVGVSTEPMTRRGIVYRRYIGE